MSDKFFRDALANFTFDFAGGDAVRRLAAKGCGVSEIMNRLDFPIPKARVADMVLKSLVDSGRVCLEKPPESGEITRVKYVKEQGANGRVSMRQVEVTVKNDNKEYVEVYFGKWKYQNKNEFKEGLAALSERDRSYVCDIKWPLTPIYHIKDEQIDRILTVFEGLQ